MAVDSDGEGNLNFGLVDTDFEPDEETDLGLVLSGYTAVTLLKGVSSGRPSSSEFGAQIEEEFSLGDGSLEFLLK